MENPNWNSVNVVKLNETLLKMDKGYNYMYETIFYLYSPV